MYLQRDRVVTNACMWGSVCNAGAGMGKFVPDVYGVARHAIFVRPDSPIRRPEDLKDVPIAVAVMAGSHYNVVFPSPRARRRIDSANRALFQKRWQL